LKARPKLTQLEHLSEVSFLVELLVLPTNVRLDWKVVARYNCSRAYLASTSVMREKGFITIDLKHKSEALFTKLYFLCNFIIDIAS
jgi:hypothetical protein